MLTTPGKSDFDIRGSIFNIPYIYPMPTAPNPALAALMDEYRRAFIDLRLILEMLSDEEYRQVRDEKTTDDDCRSIATVCHHIIRAGYGYANYLNRKGDGSQVDFRSPPESAQRAILEIGRMLDHTHGVLAGLWGQDAQEIDAWSFDASWGETYSTEQLLEHAIVHILRHRRQIEHFLQ